MYFTISPKIYWNKHKIKKIKTRLYPFMFKDMCNRKCGNTTDYRHKIAGKLGSTTTLRLSNEIWKTVMNSKVNLGKEFPVTELEEIKGHMAEQWLAVGVKNLMEVSISSLWHSPEWSLLLYLTFSIVPFP